MSFVSSFFTMFSNSFVFFTLLSPSLIFPLPLSYPFHLSILLSFLFPSPPSPSSSNSSLTSLLLLYMYHLVSLTHIPFLPLWFVLLTVLPLCIPSSPFYFKTAYINITGYWLINIVCHMLTMPSMSTTYKPTAPSTRSAASEHTNKAYKPQCGFDVWHCQKFVPYFAPISLCLFPQSVSIRIMQDTS